MIQSISQTPLLVLFILSLLPTMLINTNIQVWSFACIIIFIFFSLWVHSVVKGLIEKYEQQFNIRKFTRTLILTTLYICLLGTYNALTFDTEDEPKWLILVIIIGQFYLCINLLYIATSFAKAIASADLKRPVTLADYLGYVVLIFFFPIGIWWLYPKIRSFR